MNRDSVKERVFFSGGAVLTALILVFLILGKDVLLPVRAVVWHLNALLWWVTVLAAAVGHGALLVRLFGYDSSVLSPGMSVSVLAGLGLGSISVEVLILAALGFMNTPVLTSLVLLILFLSLLFGRRVATEVLSRAWKDAAQRAQEALLPLCMVFLSAVITFPVVLLPTRAFDALSYHLEVPLRYLQAGGMVNIPENIYSYSPLLTQMLYGQGIGLVGVDLAGLLYYTFFILTIWTVWTGGGRLFGNMAAAWAAALLAFIPVFLVEVPQAGADWSMTFFLVTALFVAAGEPRDPKGMVLAGILAGMAAGCRHQALGYGIVLIPAAGIMTDLFRKRPGLVRSWCWFTLGSTLTAAPWYLKNLLQTGDPIYPLFSSIAGNLPYDVGFVNTMVAPRSMELLWSWLLVPYQATFDPVSLSMTATIGILPIALLLVLPFVKDRPGGSLFLLLWAILSFGAWHMTFRTFRYVMPVMAVCCLWLGAVLARVTQGTGRREAAVKIAVSASLLVNAGVFIGLSDYVNHSVDAALGARSPERYLEQTYEIYPAINYLNRIDPPPGKVLFLGEMRGFYSRFPREVPSHNAPNRLLEMVKRGVLPRREALNLREAGFTHILFNPEELKRMAYRNRNAPLWVLTADEMTALHAFLLNQTELVFTANSVSVYEIKDE